jgi:5'(3')-deoxyribonucleotidase
MNTDLLIAIHHLCTYTEYKILFAAAYYEGTNPTFAEIQDVTGITQPNNYFRARKQLVQLDYLIIDDNCVRINTDKILNDYQEAITC